MEAPMPHEEEQTHAKYTQKKRSNQKHSTNMAFTKLLEFLGIGFFLGVLTIDLTMDYSPFPETPYWYYKTHRTPNLGGLAILAMIVLSVFPMVRRLAKRRDWQDVLALVLSIINGVIFAVLLIPEQDNVAAAENHLSSGVPELLEQIRDQHALLLVNMLVVGGLQLLPRGHASHAASTKKD
eukprot:m.209020 g.209020  ORF g.209020 m.209020 type:complete len:181 (-) comp15551_c6_seq1:130-672(-)